jgi:sugar/nucleoside kinase (ribokinase family)
VVFSAEGLRATAGTPDLGAGLARMAAATGSFLAVTDGPNGMLWLVPGKPGERRAMAAFPIQPVDTLAAGDVFHGAFAWGLAQGRPEGDAMRIAAAAAAIKCTRFGGITGAPTWGEVEAFLATRIEGPN